MSTIISNINISILSGGEQLFITRLGKKVNSGIILSEKERRFISDMELRGTGIKPASSKYKQSKSFNLFQNCAQPCKTLQRC